MKNVKFMIPFAVMAGIALTSCGGNGSAGRLNRETYGQEKGTFSEIAPIIWACKDNQVDTNGVYNLPEKGTFTARDFLSDSVSLSLRCIDTSEEGGVQPIAYDINDINVALGDTITSSWDLKQNLLGITDVNGDVSFVTKVGEGDEAEWRKFITTPIGSRKYYVNLDNLGKEPLESENMFKSFKNYIMCETARNNGVFSPDAYDGDMYISGLGQDMSGFGGNLMLPKPKQSNGFAGYVNYLMPGMLSNPAEITLPIGEQPLKTTLPALIDTAVAAAQAVLPQDSLTVKYTTDGSKNATAQFTVKFDVSNMQSIFDAIPIPPLPDSNADPDPEPTVHLGDFVSATGTGTICLDYFVNFKDNFVYQQELALDFDKVGLQLATDLYDWPEDLRGFVVNVIIPLLEKYLKIEIPPYNIFMLDFRDTNIHGYINGLFESGKFNYKMPSTEGYECINPK